MKQISLNTIKAQNIKNLFDIIANNNKITRSDAAKISKLSLMTISNLVEHLDKFNVLEHEDKEQTSTVGRKAELLSINRNAKKFIIIDLTSLDFSFVVLNLDLSIHYNLTEWRNVPNVSYVENLKKFLMIVKEHINSKLNKLSEVSIGVVVPGPYDMDNDIVINKRIPVLMELHLKELICEMLINDKTCENNIMIEEDVKFAAQANIVSVPDYNKKNIYYIYIGEGVGGAISINGIITRGLFSLAGDIGQVLANENTCFEEIISLKAFALEVLKNDDISGNDEDIMQMLAEFKTKSPEKFEQYLAEFCRKISLALYNIIWLIDPHEIIIECRYAELDRIYFIESIKSTLTRMLSPVRQNIPQISLSNHSIKNAHIGAGIMLRDKWLKSIS